MKSYNGKILEVDLTKKRFNELFIKEEVYKNYIGGSGLAAKLLFDNYDFKGRTLSNRNSLSSKSELLSKDSISQNYALSPENMLIFMTGPLTATKLPGCATRFSVCGISPLTGIWGESSCGGSFGVQLKQAGFDGVIIKGASNSPVYIKIIDGNVEIKDASRLWNKDTYEVYDILKRDEGVNTSVSIGIAGENKVLFANIANEPGNYAGRCGLGAAMGSKKLKAIGVKGTKRIEFADSVKINELRKELIEKQKKNIAVETLKAFGTDGAMTFYMMLGDVPIKNWNLGLWDEGGDALSGMAMAESILVKGRTCLGCPVACKRVVKIDKGKYKMNEGPGPEYETCSSFGTLCFNSDLKAVAKINELCNMYGMDTISCGGTIAFAIECAESGILKDTNDLKLSFGDADVILRLVDMIARREKGIGNLLADGSKKASKKIGKDSEKFLVEVKGLEAPMHDPRAFHGLGLAYAVSNRGACHVNSFQMWVEQGFSFFPEIGLEGPYEGMISNGKAEVNAIAQNLGSIFNSACICFFAGIPFSATDILNCLNYATAFNYRLEDMMKVGERIWYLKRGINNLLGIKREDDRLPEKILTPTTEGAAAGSVPNIKLMLNEFYKIRGFDKKGIPKKEKLEELGLGSLADNLYGK